MNDEMDFDSFLAQDMIDLEDACDCCSCLLEGMEYADEWEKGQNKRRLKEGEKND